MKSKFALLMVVFSLVTVLTPLSGFAEEKKEPAAATAAVATAQDAPAAATAAPVAAAPAAPALPDVKPVLNTGDTAWMLVSSALVLLMLPGLALFYGGMVRQKNVLSTIMHSLIGRDDAAHHGVITETFGHFKGVPIVRRLLHHDVERDQTLPGQFMHSVGISVLQQYAGTVQGLLPRFKGRGT